MRLARPSWFQGHGTTHKRTGLVQASGLSRSMLFPQYVPLVTCAVGLVKTLILARVYSFQGVGKHVHVEIVQREFSVIFGDPAHCHVAV